MTKKALVKNTKISKVATATSGSVTSSIDASTTSTVATSTDFRHRMPKDLQKFLNANQDVLALWSKLTPLAQNEWICFVTIVKKTETRASHIVRLGEDLRRGKRRPCCWPGCPHRRPKAGKWFR